MTEEGTATCGQCKGRSKPKKRTPTDGQEKSKGKKHVNEDDHVLEEGGEEKKEGETEEDGEEEKEDEIKEEGEEKKEGEIEVDGDKKKEGEADGDEIKGRWRWGEGR